MRPITVMQGHIRTHRPQNCWVEGPDPKDISAAAWFSIHRGRRLTPDAIVALVELGIALQHFHHHRIMVCQDDGTVLQATILLPLRVYGTLHVVISRL